MGHILEAMKNPVEWLWSPAGLCVLWLLLHSADHLLTIAAAKLKIRGNLLERIQFGGSIELNPLFQQEVERARWVSRPFLLTLVLGAIFLPAGAMYFNWMAGYLEWPSVAQLPEALSGGIVVTRFALISVHLQNIMLFSRMLSVPEASIVSMRYDRGTVMSVTRARKLEVASFCFLASIVSGRAFFLGGLVCTLALVGFMYLWEPPGVSGSAIKPKA
jgi:hypothetical protein